MKQKQDAYFTAVARSRILTREQKNDFLADPQLPAAYQKKVASYLATFDKHSKAREAYLRDKLEQLYTEFTDTLNKEEIEEDEKKAVLAKAKKQMEAFFPKTNAQS